VTKIREATRDDNEGLLSLTAMTPMGGDISIRTDRDPDFFRLLDRRGRSHVLVAEEYEKIVGSVSITRVPAYVDEKRESVHYLGDLKVHPDYRKVGLAAGLLKTIHCDLLADSADIVLSTVAYGNEKVLPFFEGRAGLPRAVPIGVFRVYQILPSRCRKETGRYSIREELEHPEMLRLYHDCFRHYQFGPVFEPGALQGARHLVARANGEFHASLSIVDVGDSRQNVIIRLPFFLGRLVSILGAIRRFVPVVDLPAKNTPIRMLYIKALACREGHEEALGHLIQKARNLAFEEHYHFLAIGLHETDPLGLRLAKFPKFTFKSMGFVVGLKRGNNELVQLTKRVPYEDYSLV
jgi:predicted N-acetyltransferase YhbS